MRSSSYFGLFEGARKKKTPVRNVRREMPSLSHSFVAACLLVLLLALHSAQALTTKVDPLSSLCITEPVDRDIELTMQFRVSAGGKLDIDASVFDESGRLLHGWKLATEGQYKVKGDPQNRKFKICFDNHMARFTPKWVDFYLHHGQHPSAVKVDQLDPVERQIEQLKTNIDDLVNVQQRLRVAEKNHRATIEDANERVLLWSVFEIVALFGMGIFQIYFLKRFLERKTSA
jgi:hypothetical protein